MLPHWHFVIGAAFAAVLWWFTGPEPVWTLAAWALSAGAVGAVIDMDIMAIVKRAGAKDVEVMRWADPRVVFGDFKGFVRMLRAKGLLRTAGVTHVSIGVVITLLAWLLTPDYLVPVLVGVLTHLGSDLQHLIPPRD